LPFEETPSKISYGLLQLPCVVPMSQQVEGELTVNTLAFRFVKKKKNQTRIFKPFSSP